jgi:hypothetical protein
MKITNIKVKEDMVNLLTFLEVIVIFSQAFMHINCGWD